MITGRENNIYGYNIKKLLSNHNFNVSKVDLLFVIIIL